MKHYFLFAVLFFSLTIPSTNKAIILLGSQWTKTYESELPMACVICQHETLHVISLRRWLTVFFINTCPTSYKEYYFECPECKNCYALKDVDIEELLAAAKRN